MENLKNLKFRQAMKPDECSKLLIRKANLEKAISALEWVCEDRLDFSLTKFEPGPTEGTTIQVKYTDDPVEIEIPGKFSQNLSTEDISSICDDWEILHSHYPDYSRLYESEFDEQLSTALFDVLIQKVIANKPNAKLSNWAKRALEIKQANKKE